LKLSFPMWSVTWPNHNRQDLEIKPWMNFWTMED
jgi:hypothetical protein